MARKAAKWSLSRKMRDMASWLRLDTEVFKRDRPRNELKHLLQTEGDEIAGYVANRLEDIALWNSQAGAYAVLQGNPTGWNQLQLGYQYSSWRVRICNALLPNDHKENRKTDYLLMQGVAARCLAQAFVFGDGRFAKWCSQLLLTSSEQPSLFTDWEDSQFHCFMTRLAAMWMNSDISPKQPNSWSMGVYQRILDSWETDDTFVDAVKLACNYHCDRTAQLEDEDTEFWRPPFQVFPAEILAVLRLREERVGAVPPIRHPLLDTPLARPMIMYASPEDELLTSVISRFSALDA